LTIEIECEQDQAIRRVARWAGKPLPLSGAAWNAGRLSLRLSGARTETAAASETLGSPTVRHDPDFWRDLREHRLEFFDSEAPLWRISVPAHTAPLDLPGDCLLDWGGAQRWYSGPASADAVRSAADDAGGHATLFRGEIAGAARFPPLPAPLQALNDRVRHAFDPLGLFNGATGA
jgi:glycolate oxidase FAD binding subunit